VRRRSFLGKFLAGILAAPSALLALGSGVPVGGSVRKVDDGSLLFQLEEKKSWLIAKGWEPKSFCCTEETLLELTRELGHPLSERAEWLRGGWQEVEVSGLRWAEICLPFREIQVTGHPLVLGNWPINAKWDE